MVHLRREWQTTSVFLPGEPHAQCEKQKDMTGEDEPLWSEGVRYAIVDKHRTITNSFRKMKWLGQNGNDTQLCMCLVVKVKSDGVKNHIA